MTKVFYLLVTSAMLFYSSVIRAAEIPPQPEPEMIVPLNMFVADPSGGFVWPSVQNKKVSINSTPHSPVFSNSSIRIRLDSFLNGSTYITSDNLAQGKLSISLSVTIPRTDPYTGEPYYFFDGTYVSCFTSENRTPVNIWHGQSVTLLAKPTPDQRAWLICYTGWGYFANIDITKITFTEGPNGDLAAGPISIPEVSVDANDGRPIVPVGVPVQINVPVSVSLTGTHTPEDLSTLVPIRLQAGSQTLTQNISLATIVANQNNILVPFMVTFQPIDVGINNLIATVNPGNTLDESNFSNNESSQQIYVSGKYKIKKTISVIKNQTLTQVGDPDLFQMIPTINTIKFNNAKNDCKKIHVPSKIRIKIECQNDNEISDNIEGCKIQLYKELGEFYGGHFQPPHDISERPLGLFAPQEIENQFNVIPLSGLIFDYEAPEPAGEIGLNFIAVGPDNQIFKVPKSVAQVKIDGLISLAGVPNLTMQNTGHLTQDETEEAGVFATSEYKKQIQAALELYYQSCLEENIPENQIVLLTSEAASLVWGGLYDIKFNWRPSHCGHRNGDAIDIGMANFKYSSSPHKEKMKKILEESLLDSELYFPVPSESPTGSKHWHTQLK